MEVKIHFFLFDKEEKDLLPSEKRKVKDYDANLAELKAEKKEWIELLKKTQKQQGQGIGSLLTNWSWNTLESYWQY